MSDRERLIEILRVPIYSHELADPAEVVADYLLDNGVTVRNKAHWIIHRSGKTNDAPKYAECSNCRVTGSPLWKSCPVCDSLMEG